MAPLSRRRFATNFRAAAPATMTGFVAALYEARGWTVDYSGESAVVFTATRGTDSERVAIAAGDPVPAPVDTLVVTAPALDQRELEAERWLTIDDLYTRLLYGIDRQQAAQLCDEWLDIQFDEVAVDSLTDADESAAPPPATASTTAAAEHPNSVTSAATSDSQTSSAGQSRRRSRFRLGALVALIAVGCLAVVVVAGGGWLSGPTGGFDGGAAVAGPTPTETATPVSVSVPTATATATRVTDQRASPAVVPMDAPLAPGVDRSGIVDYQRLVDANRAQLDSTSFRVTLVYREFENGSVTGISRQTVRAENATTYHASVVETGQFESAPPSLVFNDAYTNGSVLIERTDDGITRRPVSGEGPFLDALSRYLGYYLSVEDSRLVDYRRTGGRSVLQIATDGDPYPGVENATGSALVTDTGIVMQVWRAYDDPYSDARVVVTIEVSDVGQTAITRPDWSL